MAGRRFDVADVMDVLQHWHAGRSDRQLSRSFSMGRNRVARITAAAEAAGIVPGSPALSRQEWEQRVPILFPERIVPRPGEGQDELSRVHDAIVAGLEASTVTTVWQRLHDEGGVQASLSTFRRYVRQNIRMVRPEDVTVRKEVTPPGEVAEVDYGRLGRWFDAINDRWRTVWAFVMTLAYSRMVFVQPVIGCDQSSWVAAHVAAFAFFGGAPQQIRLDNLKTGVLRADIYDPQMNRAYVELATHYGILLDPCRAGKPKDKPRVERTMPYVRDSLWSGRDFDRVPAMQGEALRWCAGTAANRPHGDLPGTVGEIFRRLEHPALLPLPAEPFEIAYWATATVHPDCRVQVQRRFYSVPWANVGKRVHVRVGEKLAHVYDGSTLIKTHLLRSGERHHVDLADYPEQKVAFLQRTPAWCRRRAVELGPAVEALVDELLAGPHPLACLRQAQGIIRLADVHDAAHLDAACARALVADGSLRTVRNILALPRSVEETPHSSSAGAFLHGQQVLLTGTPS
ncbi:MAG: IS21 family transposase [Candidatus Dormibacteria bacterium]